MRWVEFSNMGWLDRVGTTNLHLVQYHWDGHQKQGANRPYCLPM